MMLLAVWFMPLHAEVPDRQQLQTLRHSAGGKAAWKNLA